MWQTIHTMSYITHTHTKMELLETMIDTRYSGLVGLLFNHCAAITCSYSNVHTHVGLEHVTEAILGTRVAEAGQALNDQGLAEVTYSGLAEATTVPQVS